MLQEHGIEMVLDTETTGFLHDGGDRVIEIGIIELSNRKPTGREYHVYINPERDVPEDAYAIHGLSRDDLVRLSKGKVFADYAPGLLEFVGKHTIVAHNAGFDIRFLDAELKACGMRTLEENGNPIIDTLKLANVMYPGQANNLDALYKRLFGNPPTDRELHGALLDASLLAQTYTTMTVKQGTLEVEKRVSVSGPSLKPRRIYIEPGELLLAQVDDGDRERHKALNERIRKTFKDEPLTQSLDF